MEEPKCTRRRVYRLRNLESIAAEMLEELSALSKDESQSAAKRSVALFTKAELVMSLINASSSEARAKLKHGTEEPEPPDGKNSKPQAPKADSDAAARVAKFQERISNL